MRLERLLQKQQQLKDAHLLRTLESKSRNSDSLSFCSNDYLNLASHPQVIRALQDAATTYGLGSTGSAQISGYTEAHQQLEHDFATFLKRDKALLFNSGYHANMGVITTFANRHSHVIADKLAHASIIDGILLSRAKHRRFAHNDTQHAKKLLQENDGKKILISESVASMQGDIADIKTLATHAKEANAFLIVDDAHGIGVLGKHGGGICDLQQLSQTDVPCLITPLGKAIGSMGAIVSGSFEVMEIILQNARTHRYSTALPPSVCHATSAALKVLIKEPNRKQHLDTLILFFNKEAMARNLPLFSLDLTPIKSIILRSNALTLHIQQKLQQQKIAIAAIRPPTVPLDQACIRISLNYTHTTAQITHLLDLIQENLHERSQ